MKKISLRFILFLLCYHIFVHTEAKENIDYTKYIEDNENIIFSEINEEIKFDKEKDKVTAHVSVTKKLLATRFGDSYTENITYDNQMRKLNLTSARTKSSAAGVNHTSKQTSYGIFYDGLTLCTVNFNFLKKDETGVLSFEMDFSDVIYLARYNLAEDLFTANKTVTIEIPNWLDMDIIETNFDKSIKKEVKEESKKKIVTYTIKNMKAIASENFSPSIACTYPDLLFVYKSAQMKNGDHRVIFKTAQDQYKWYKNLQEGVVVKNDSICNETQNIIAKCQNDREKIATIYEWVHENIRYIAFEDGMAGFRPKPANEVMNNKYGDCKGMANLLCGMLQCAGIDARLVWIGTKSLPYDYSTPSLGVDNHAICAAIMGKDTIYLDGTCSYAPLGHNPSSIAGKATMIANGNDCILSHVPDAKPSQNVDSIHVSIYTTENGLEGTFCETSTGDQKIRFMNQIESNDNDLYETLKDLGYYGLPFDEDKVIIEKGRQLDKDVIVKYPINLSRDLCKNGDDYYVCMDSKRTLSTLNIDTTKRKTDLLLPEKSIYVYESELNIPQGYKVSELPNNLTLDKNKYQFDITYQQKGNKVIYKRKLTIKDPLIKKNEFKEWNNDIKKLKESYLSMIILSKGNRSTASQTKASAATKQKTATKTKAKKTKK